MPDALVMPTFSHTLYSVPKCVMQGHRAVFDSVYGSYIEFRDSNHQPTHTVPLEWVANKKQWILELTSIAPDTEDVDEWHDCLESAQQEQTPTKQTSRKPKQQSKQSTQTVSRENHNYLMHCRTSHAYGHLMSKLDYADGELWWTGQRRCVCRTCMLVNGKHAPEPTSSNSIPPTYVGELVHSDTKGPLKCESVGGCKYQCVIIDDYSNFARVYNIKSKKQTLECLDKFRMLLSKHGHTIKAMRRKTRRSKNERLKIAGSQSTTLFFVSISSSGGLRRQRCCRR